jgi:hypothetical protein
VRKIKMENEIYVEGPVETAFANGRIKGYLEAFKDIQPLVIHLTEAFKNITEVANALTEIINTINAEVKS